MILDDMIKGGSKFLIINQNGNNVSVATSTDDDDELFQLITNYVESEVIQRKGDAEKIAFMTALILGIRNVAEEELPEEKKMVFHKTVHAIMAGLFDTEWSEFNERMGN